MLVYFLFFCIWNFRILADYHTKLAASKSLSWYMFMPICINCPTCSKKWANPWIQLLFRNVEFWIIHLCPCCFCLNMFIPLFCSLISVNNMSQWHEAYHLKQSSIQLLWIVFHHFSTLLSLFGHKHKQKSKTNSNKRWKSKQWISPTTPGENHVQNSVIPTSSL